ncbi:MAG: hypothetical protein PHV18_14190 [Lachnospiraceae bacterium]|nr:hypothetical protein [Lachnospiraceae bacterium]
MALKDVTDEVLGTKNNVPSAATQELPINPPVVQSPRDKGVVSVETTESLKNLDKLFRNVTKNFIEIGFELYQLQKSKRYKELGYSRFDDFVLTEMKLSKSAAYNFINVCAKFSLRDENNQPSKVLAKEYSRYSSSQLTVMLSLDKDTIITVDPEKSVSEIKKLTKKSKDASGAGQSDNDSDNDNENDSDSDGGKVDKSKKKSVRDTVIPVKRIVMATGRTWDSVLTETVHKASDAFLNDEKRKSDGHDYRIEVCIVYTDEEAI